MDAFPAFFPLTGRIVVIAGEGEAAEARARLFESSPAQIVRLSHDAALTPNAYEGAVLAFIAGGDDAFLRAAAQAARAAGVPVNVMDRPALCDFATPAVIDRGAVVAAVGTGGASPLLAAMLRNDIEARVPEGAGRVAALLSGMQDDIRRSLPDLPQRRAFLRRTVDGPAAKAAMDGDMEAAHQLLRAALTSAIDAPTATGRVTVIGGLGPTDLLSLRALRALGQADVLIAEDGCVPDIIALARRDARRLAPAEATSTTLNEMTDAGLKVVWLSASKGPDSPKVLAEARATVEILASAPAG